ADAASLGARSGGALHRGGADHLDPVRGGTGPARALAAVRLPRDLRDHARPGSFGVARVLLAPAAAALHVAVNVLSPYNAAACVLQVPRRTVLACAPTLAASPFPSRRSTRCRTTDESTSSKEACWSRSLCRD